MHVLILSSLATCMNFTKCVVLSLTKLLEVRLHPLFLLYIIEQSPHDRLSIDTRKTLFLLHCSTHYGDCSIRVYRSLIILLAKHFPLCLMMLKHIRVTPIQVPVHLKIPVPRPHPAFTPSHRETMSIYVTLPR